MATTYSLQADARRRTLADEFVLELATSEQRILVTRNARHFHPLARSWVDEHRSHTGLILVWSMPSNASRDIVAAVDRALVDRSNPDEWRDLVLSV